MSTVPHDPADPFCTCEACESPAARAQRSEGLGRAAQGPRAKVQGQGLASKGRVTTPLVLGRITTDEDVDLYRLIDAYLEGKITPQPIALGSLPAHAADADRRLAERLGLLMGLRAADGDYRPLPCAERFACRLLGWETGEMQRGRVRRMLGRLVRWGVIVPGPDLPRREGMAHGTKTFGPPSVADGQAGAVGVEALDQPVPEPAQQVVVHRAQDGGGADLPDLGGDAKERRQLGGFGVGVIAPWDLTGEGFGHEDNSITDTGRTDTNRKEESMTTMTTTETTNRRRSAV